MNAADIIAKIDAKFPGGKTFQVMGAQLSFEEWKLIREILVATPASILAAEDGGAREDDHVFPIANYDDVDQGGLRCRLCGVPRWSTKPNDICPMSAPKSCDRGENS